MKLFLTFFLAILFQVSLSKLVHVQIVSRHCDRTPVSIEYQLPRNPIDWRKLFNLGAGQLTPLGMQQCKALGEKIRSRYISEESPNRISEISNGFLADDYNFHSTAFERTIISINSIATGLFPNGQLNFTQQQKIHPHQPIPVFTIKQEDDAYFSQYEKCGMSERRDSFTTTSSWEQLEQENKEFLAKVGEISGVQGLTVKNMARFGDNVMVQNFHNLLTPELKENFKKIEELFEMNQHSYFARETWGRVGGGPLAKLIIDGMISFMDKKSTAKYVHYSAHDSSIAILLAGMRLDKQDAMFKRIPSYGSVLAFELHQEEETKWFIKVVYSRGFENPNFDSVILKPYGCKEDKCLYTQFENEMLKDLVISWEEWCLECGRNLKQCLEIQLSAKNIETVGLSATIVFSLLFNLCAVFIILSLCICKTCVIPQDINQSRPWSGINVE